MVAIAIGGVAWVFVYPHPVRRAEGRAAHGERRALGADAAARRRARRRSRGASRSKARSRSSKQRQKTAKRVPLSVRIAQAGLSWSKRRFMIIAGSLGFVRLLSRSAGGGGLLPALGFALCRPASAFRSGCCRFSRSGARRSFLETFPGRRRRHRARHQGRPAAARQPQLIADEAPEPVRSEFRSIIETQTIGIPLGEACLKLYERMPVPEANFFAIVISIQQRAGGNLSEALGNLSRVLRDRKKMKAKIQAMSMEAKASAAIIGALPIAVMLLVYITSPQYIELLVDRAARPHDARLLRHLDVDRHLGHAQDDQFRFLRRCHAPTFDRAVHRSRSFSPWCSRRSRRSRPCSRWRCRYWRRDTLSQAHEGGRVRAREDRPARARAAGAGQQGNAAAIAESVHEDASSSSSI